MLLYVIKLLSNYQLLNKYWLIYLDILCIYLIICLIDLQISNYTIKLLLNLKEDALLLIQFTPYPQSP